MSLEGESEQPTRVKPASSHKEILEAIKISLTGFDLLELDKLAIFAKSFRKHRIRLGFTQTNVAEALFQRYGVDFSQTTISRFEALNLSYSIMRKMKPRMEEWLTDVENRQNAASPDTFDGNSVTDFLRHDPDHTYRRRKRTHISKDARNILEMNYTQNSTPSHVQIETIATLLGLEHQTVRTWFSNKRQKMRKEGNDLVQDENPLLISLKALASGKAIPEMPPQ